MNDILDRLALLSKVAEKYCQVNTEGEKPFGFLHIVFRGCTTGEMREVPIRSFALPVQVLVREDTKLLRA